MRKDIYFDSCGYGRIHVSRWEPKAEPCAVVQILHGIADYSERYDDFANYLTDMGFLVVADDHMGHGRSVRDGDVSCYFTGGWFNAVEDSYQLLKMMRQEFPQLPYVLFGHSMGSFMTQTILQMYPDSGIDACILCGSGWQPDAALSAGIRLCRTACRLYGETKPSPRLIKLVFGAYNLKIEHPRTPYDWVCRDKRVVDALLNDPLCSHSISTGLMRDMLEGIRFIQTEDNLRKMRKTLPVLLVSGGDDPVGTFGEGVRKLAEVYDEIGMEAVMTRIYPLCRHEILNEINKAEVYDDISSWMLRHIHLK